MTMLKKPRGAALRPGDVDPQNINSAIYVNEVIGPVARPRLPSADRIAIRPDASGDPVTSRCREK